MKRRQNLFFQKDTKADANKNVIGVDCSDLSGDGSTEFMPSEAGLHQPLGSTTQVWKLLLTKRVMAVP